MIEETRPIGDGAEADEGIYKAACEALGWICPEFPTVEVLLLANADQLRWPRVLALVVKSGTGATTLEKILRFGNELADATKNLPGPVTCLLVSASGCGSPEARAPDVWEPLYPWPKPLPFSSGSASLGAAGFDIYLSYRVYWEAAGQEELLEILGPVFGRSVEFAIAHDTDKRVDRQFDTLLEGKQVSAEELVEAFETAFEVRHATVVLANGVVVGSTVPLWRLLTSGLAWCPPGGPHAFITPLAAKHLSGCERFVKRHGLTPDQVLVFRRAVRHNHMLSAWALQLTAQVERELLMICRQDSRIDKKIEEFGMGDRLRQEHARVAKDIAYDVKSELIEYASFRDLQTLIAQTELGSRCPVSEALLNRVRQTRNLCAHLHPVSWQAVKTVLTALERMSGTDS